MSSSAAVGESYVDYGPMVIEILSPLMVLVTIVLALRTWAVLRRHGHLSVDDWLAIGAFVRLGKCLLRDQNSHTA